MAGDWIKMRADLRSHPKVVRISSALHADRLKTVGGLHAVWCLFDAHSVDGSLEGYTLETVDELIGWPGFAVVMRAIGWLDDTDPEGLRLPEFDTHNGASAKRRAMEADRKRREREEEAEAKEADRKASADDADKKRTRGEKRREEKRDNPPALQGPPAEADESPILKAKDIVAEGVDSQVASDWLKIRRAKKAPLTQTAWDAVKREAALAALTPAQAVKVASENSWQGFKASWVERLEKEKVNGHTADRYAGATI